MTNNIRKLVYVPILHAREERAQMASVQDRVTNGNSGQSGAASAFIPRAALGTVADKDEHKSSAAGGSPTHPSAIGEMWAGIAAKIEALDLPWNKTRIYQDGLPVCGKESGIVARLAEQGSGNHRLLMDLLKKGAQLEGTENMDFLMLEYDLLNVLLMKQATAEKSAALVEYQAQSRALLSQRDAFIAQRLKTTLQAGEVPLVFMGVMHRLDKMLENDFLVSCVIYRLPFRSVGAIYNA